MKKGALMVAVFSCGFLAGCGIGVPELWTEQVQQIAWEGLEYLNTTTSEFIQNNEYAQQATQYANSGVEYLKTKTTQLQGQASELIQQTTTQIQTQYDQLKTDLKTEVKNNLNQKIDSTFERF